MALRIFDAESVKYPEVDCRQSRASNRDCPSWSADLSGVYVGASSLDADDDDSADVQLHREAVVFDVGVQGGGASGELEWLLRIDYCLPLKYYYYYD